MKVQEDFLDFIFVVLLMCLIISMNWKFLMELLTEVFACPLLNSQNYSAWNSTFLPFFTSPQMTVFKSKSTKT